MEKFFNFLLDLIFPKFCVNCQKEGEFLCPSCFKKIIKIQIPQCPFCLKISPFGKVCPSCRRKNYLTGVIVAGYFEGPLKKAIYVLKYEKIRSLSLILALLLKEKLEDFPKKNFVITFVPLHFKRKNERGFNQSKLLAENLSIICKKPCFTLLKRQKYILPQTELNKKQRQENIKNAFIFIGNQNDIKNKVVLIVDDVFTTGATLNECAKVLRENGAKEVWGIVLAHQK